MNSQCVFCKIANRAIPASIVQETDDIIAFDDNARVAPTHVLIIPKTHVASINDLTSDHHEIMGHMMAVANQVAKAKAVDRSGFRLVLNTGHDAGQSVFHVHMHLIGGRHMAWPPG